MLMMASLHATGTPVPERKGKIEKQITRQNTKQDCQQRVRASISFTDACGNQLTITGTCEGCTDIAQWNTVFNSWWAQNSTGGCINQQWLQ